MVNQGSQQSYVNPPDPAPPTLTINLIERDMAIGGIEEKVAAKPVMSTDTLNANFAGNRKTNVSHN